MEPGFSSVFELEPTLRRINGNVALLKKLMGSFARHYRTIGDDLADLLRRQDYAGAEMLCHRLAAAAAQLGAIKLSETAGNAEQALKDRSVADIDRLLSEIERLVAQATAAAAAYSAAP